MTINYPAVLESFLAEAQAATHAGRTRNFKLAHLHIRLVYSNPVFEQLIWNAFAHLEVETEKTPDLTIWLWDSTSTRQPAPQWIQTLTETQQSTTYKTENQILYLQFPPRSAYTLNLEHKQAVFWAPDDAIIQPDASSPLIPILHWWLAERGLQFVHAGLVGDQALGGALLVGPGGSGKSTAALSCLGSELAYLADDYCVIDPETLFGYSIYATGKLADDSLHRLPHLAQFETPIRFPDWEKNQFYLYPGYKESFLTQIPLRVILLPTVSSEGVAKLEPVSPIIAFQAIVPSTVLQLRYSRDPQGIANAMKKVVSRRPAYRLWLGPHLDENRALIQEALAA